MNMDGETQSLIFGYLIPPGLFSMLSPWYTNLIDNMATVHWIHRWLAFVVLMVAGALYYRARRQNLPRHIQRAAVTEITLISLQILLGLGVIIWHVPVWLAIIHQGMALVLFVVALFINHRLPGSDPAG